MSDNGMPLWRLMFESADRLVTPAANTFLGNDLFSDLMGAVTRLEYALRRQLDQQWSAYWHMFGLPSTVDMRRVLTRVSNVEARLRDIADRLDELDAMSAEAEASRD